MTNNIDPNLLRCPEGELFRSPAAVEGVLNGFVFNVRAPFEPYPLGHEPDWTIDPYSDRTWCLYFHSLYWLQAIDEALRAGPVNKQGELKLHLKNIVLSYAKFSLSRADEAPHDVWDDHSTSYRLSHLSYIYASNLYDDFTSEEFALFFKMISFNLQKIKGFLESDKWALSNHTLFQIEGLLDAAYVFLIGGEQKDIFNFAINHFEAWLRRIVHPEDGSVKEHAAFYHVFLMARIAEFYKYFKGIVGDNCILNIDRLLRKMSMFLYHMSVKFGQIPAVGDTKYGMNIDPKYLSQFKSRKYLTPHGEYLLSGGKKGRADRGLSSYVDDGFYFVRNGPRSEELFSCFLHKPYIGPHGHVDGLSFELYYKNICVFTDSGGPYKYGNKMRYQYFRVPLAHNCVVVNDGQQVYNTSIERARSSNGITLIKGVAQIENDVRWVRGFIQLRNNYIVIVDLIDSPNRSVDAYARFQTGLKISYRFQKEKGLFALIHNDLIGEIGFYKDFPNNSVAPKIVRKRDFVISERNGKHLMHERAYITRKDNAYKEVPLLKSALASNGLHATVCSFGGTLTCHWESGGGKHKCLLQDRQRGWSYEVAVTERRKGGLVRGFALSAKQR